MFSNLVADLGVDHIGEVLRIYLDNANLGVDAVRKCLDAGDIAGAGDAAHRLKSASGFIGATGLVALCAAVEAGSPPAGAGMLLARELQRTAAALHVLVTRISGAA